MGPELFSPLLSFLRDSGGGMSDDIVEDTPAWKGIQSQAEEIDEDIVTQADEEMGWLRRSDFHRCDQGGDRNPHAGDCGSHRRAGR